jgi:hypothetical protein
MAASGQRPNIFASTEADTSFGAIVAPIFAGFSLPAITGLAVSTTPPQPWHDVALSLLISATGFFLASLQLNAASLYRRYLERLRPVRAVLSYLGIIFLVAALIVLVASVAGHWWVSVALTVLALGGLVPIIPRAWPYLRKTPSAADAGSASME